MSCPGFGLTQTLLLLLAFAGSARTSSAQLAVTLPFTEELLPRLPLVFERWRLQAPCTSVSFAAEHNVSFVFQFNRVITPALRRSLDALWSAAGDASQRCFSSVLFLSANQSDAQEAHKILAGCYQHYGTYRQLQRLGFQHWLQYESDVLPVRPNWLARLADEAARNGRCHRWWVQGAAQAYNLSTVTKGERLDGVMLNGNALYCISDDVLSYLDDVQARFPPAGCHDAPRRANAGRWASQRSRLPSASVSSQPAAAGAAASTRQRRRTSGSSAKAFAKASK